MEQIFYIPINSGSLAHYLSRALILPSKYLSNKPEDIQNKFEHSILLSKKQWVKNSDCSIEIVLTTEEVKELNNLTNDFFQLNIPLPISRIRKIYFLDEKQMETTVWNINNGAAFIPQHLIAIANKDNVIFTDNNFISKEASSNLSGEIEKKINRFDTALGGFAFMKVGRKNNHTIPAEFSENYFITLSYFNKLIEEQTTEAEKDKNLSFSRKYLGLFSINNSEWSKWQAYIYKYVDLQDVEEIAAKEGTKVEKKLGVLNIDSIDKQSHLFDIAILATYGDRKNKSVDDLVNSLHNGVIPENKIEDIAILFGLNTGYTKFRNKYKANNRDYDVKYKLDSKLDYYTIESIYQSSFNQNRSNYKFEFIDKLNLPKTSNLRFVEFETYTILDKTIIAKKKKTPLDSFLEKYANGFYEKLSESTKQFLPPYVSFDSEKSINHFKELLNNDFISALQQYEKNIKEECEKIFNETKLLYEEKINSLHIEINELKNVKVVEPITPKTQAEEREFTIINKSDVLIDNEKNYENMSLSDLKKEAKEKRIKIGTKATKKEIIELIKNTPLLL